MATRGLHGTMEELAPYLKKPLHPEASKEELARRGAEGPFACSFAETDSGKRRCIKALLRRCAARYPEDCAFLKDLSLLEDLSLSEEFGQGP